MGRKKEGNDTQMVSVRLEVRDYDTFKKLCHTEFSQMATIARGLILEWVEKHKKRLK